MNTDTESKDLFRVVGTSQEGKLLIQGYAEFASVYKIPIYYTDFLRSRGIVVRSVTFDYTITGVTIRTSKGHTIKAWLVGVHA